MDEFLQSEFGAGVSVGLSIAGIAIGLNDNGSINWAFVGTSIIGLIYGLAVFCAKKLKSKRNDQE
ncbi:hypothetical protein [Herbaspirillum aquaticum]|uniref:Uncharacterized protein n=1 Tax=Herbaspirillum huttiense subsp. nephrolepidis TaxID=3075126 RepID=A0AAE4GAM8_9BURK|nr:hypothetical protein [Herbaspirillum aquaticum]